MRIKNRVKSGLKWFGEGLLWHILSFGGIIFVAFLLYGGLQLYMVVSENPDIVKNPVELFRELTKHNSTVEDSKKAVELINRFREFHHKRPIKFDIRAYNLALARAKDMVEGGYYSHKTPEGKTVYDIKHLYGFLPIEGTAECLYAEYAYPTQSEKVKFAGYYRGIEKNAIEEWVNSYEHRKILLDSAIYNGSVACYEGVCVFIGVYPEII